MEHFGSGYLIKSVVHLRYVLFTPKTVMVIGYGTLLTSSELSQAGSVFDEPSIFPISSYINLKYEYLCVSSADHVSHSV